jgi:hypothetical protein
MFCLFIIYVGCIVQCRLVGISACRHRLTLPIKISSMLENNEFVEKLAESGGS